MSFLHIVRGRLTPCEELILKCIREIGPGATFMQIFEKAQERTPIRYLELHKTLFRLDYFGCVYSWSDDAESETRWLEGHWSETRKTRHFRVQLHGLRLVEAAERRRKKKRRSKGLFSSPGMITLVWSWFYRRT